MKYIIILALGVGLMACGSKESKETTMDSAESAMPEAAAQVEMPAAVSQPWQITTMAYFRIKDAFVSSDLEAAQMAATEMASAIAGADMAAMGEQHNTWMAHAPNLAEMAANVGKAGSLEEARTAFSNMTAPMVQAIKVFGDSGQDMYVQYCPMAFDNAGASWVSSESTIRNPYFGDAMLTCGKVTEEL